MEEWTGQTMYAYSNWISYSMQKVLYSSWWFLLTLIRLGGGWRSHHWRYPSTISKWLDIMSSLLVTFIFKTYQKHRRTQFSNLFCTNMKNLQLKTTGQHWFSQNKKEIWFFQFFFKQIILFQYDIEFYVKKCFLLRYRMLKWL